MDMQHVPAERNKCLRNEHIYCERDTDYTLEVSGLSWLKFLFGLFHPRQECTVAKDTGFLQPTQQVVTQIISATPSNHTNYWLSPLQTMARTGAQAPVAVSRDRDHHGGP